MDVLQEAEDGEEVGAVNEEAEGAVEEQKQTEQKQAVVVAAAVEAEAKVLEAWKLGKATPKR